VKDLHFFVPEDQPVALARRKWRGEREQTGRAYDYGALEKFDPIAVE
jgi:hypothetical protein